MLGKARTGRQTKKRTMTLPSMQVRGGDFLLVSHCSPILLLVSQDSGHLFVGQEVVAIK